MTLLLEIGKMFLIIGIISFLLYYLYDLNRVFIGIEGGKYIFPTASVLLFVAFIGLGIRNLSYMIAGGLRVLWILVLLVFFALLIYTLFFALPVEEAYNESVKPKEDKQKVMDKGMYALSRHPGVLWFAGMALSLYILIPTSEMAWGMLIFTIMDFLYIVLQDLVIFPRQFEDYNEYKNTTPFLIPNGRSLKRAFQTFRKDPFNK